MMFRMSTVILHKTSKLMYNAFEGVHFIAPAQHYKANYNRVFLRLEQY